MKKGRVQHQMAIRVGAVVLAASITIGDGQTTDHKTINLEETYQYEGQAVLLKQVPGEMLVHLDEEAADSTTEIRTEASGTYALWRKVGKRSGFFTVQPPVEASDQFGQSAIDALNTDSRVRYVFPVFVNPENGKRVFLNDEIVVGFNETMTDPWKVIDGELGLRLTETLSVRDRLYVFRLVDPKNTNPFRACQALLENRMVAWAEPNFIQEG